MQPIALKALTRRASLLTFGAVGITAAITHTHFADAKKRRRKQKGKQLKSDALCKQQVGQCIDFFTPDCQGNPDCLATIDRCCPSLGSCELDGFFDCVSGSAESAGLASLEIP